MTNDELLLDLKSSLRSAKLHVERIKREVSLLTDRSPKIMKAKVHENLAIAERSVLDIENRIDKLELVIKNENKPMSRYPSDEEIKLLDEILLFHSKPITYRDFPETKFGLTRAQYEHKINKIVRFSRECNPIICKNDMETCNDGTEHLSCNEDTKEFIEKGGFKGHYDRLKAEEIERNKLFSSPQSITNIHHGDKIEVKGNNNSFGDVLQSSNKEQIIKPATPIIKSIIPKIIKGLIAVLTAFAAIATIYGILRQYTTVFN